MAVSNIPVFFPRDAAYFCTLLNCVSETLTAAWLFARVDREVLGRCRSTPPPLPPAAALRHAVPARESGAEVTAVPVPSP